MGARLLEGGYENSRACRDLESVDLRSLRISEVSRHRQRGNNVLPFLSVRREIDFGLL